MKKKTLSNLLSDAESEIMRLNNALADSNRKRGEAFLEAYFKNKDKKGQLNEIKVDERPIILQRLKDIALRSDKDPERDHIDADHALLDLINDQAITEAYLAIKKWYA